MNEYKPNKIEDGISVHVQRNAFWWALAIVACGTFAGIALWKYQATMPAAYLLKDPNSELRSVLGTIIHLFLVLSAATGAVLFYDWKTNGNLLGRMLQTSMACGIFAAAVFFGVCLLGCYV